MEKQNISKILKRYLSGRFANETEERVQRWIIKKENKEEKEQASLEYWNEMEAKVDSKTYLALERVNHRIGFVTPKAKCIPLYRKVSRIAAVLLPLLLLAGSYVYYTTHKLTEVYVAYGEEKHLFLPDSSEVWLNAGTTIKYSPKNNSARRLVYLDGEAYFSVKRDENKPFIVQAQQLSVKVLGTRFNVKAYSGDEKIITTLESGKVEVALPVKEARVLKPDEQLAYHVRTSAIDVTKVIATEAIGWREGQLIFTNASLKEMLQTLERRFDIPIISHRDISTSQLYTIKFLKGESLEEILDVLQDLIGFTYQKQPNQIVLN